MKGSKINTKIRSVIRKNKIIDPNFLFHTVQNSVNFGFWKAGEGDKAS